MSRYEEFHRQSIDAPEAFWAEQAPVSYTHLTLPTKA